MRRPKGTAVDTNHLLDVGARGIHLLFDSELINEAFGQDADQLRASVEGRFSEIHAAIERLVRLPSVSEGRRFIQDLSPAIRHVLVLLYFELLDRRLGEGKLLH